MVTVVSVLARSPTTAAQTATGSAEVLFREGKRLMAEGNVAAVCEAFEGSYGKDPAVSTLLNLADCRDKNQQYASGWGHFVEAARKARSLPDGAALIEVAQRRAQHCHRLKILGPSWRDKHRLDPDDRPPPSPERQRRKHA